MLKKISLVFTLLFLVAFNSVFAFTVVLDAGHGGDDPGAIGAFSKEKNINLKYILGLGAKIKANNPDVKVIYTRTTDFFVPLNTRADIANKAHADLFISIHTNASKSKDAKGTETFTLGLARSKENMELAMLENSVILLENDYKKNYQGFDPNSVDSYIMFQFMQDQYMDQSVHLAEIIQKNFVKGTPMIDRGVRQAGFLVLRATTMPSVLVELGFITNKEEEVYLNKEETMETMTQSLYESFLSYKHQIEKKNGDVKGGNSNSTTVYASKSTATEETEKVEKKTSKIKKTGKITPIQEDKKEEIIETPTKSTEAQKNVSSEILFKVQFLVSKTKYKEGHSIFKGVKNIDHYYENGYYKYTSGNTSNVDSINALKNQISKKFPDAFLIAYKKNVRMNIHDALKEAETNIKK